MEPPSLPPSGFTLSAALAVAAVEFVLVGAVAWVLRRKWRSSFGPPFVPTAFLTITKIVAAGVDDPAGRAQAAAVSVFVGLVWWTIFAVRDGRPRDRDAA
jgi:hypothetical protein